MESVMLEKIPQSLGRAFKDRRAGAHKVLFTRLHAEKSIPLFEVRSDAFLDGQPLPMRYSADGAGLSPPLEWRGIPHGTQSVAVIVEDPDAPSPEPLVHAIVVGLPPQGSLAEGALDSPDHEGVGHATGRNSYLRQSWLPPDPPNGHGAHRYVFQVFALGPGRAFSATPGRQEFYEVVRERALAAGLISGTYERGH
jgi:Raf kinase inhibitor-like YbhB/YbcL family protein